VRLTAQERSRLTQARPVNPEAHEAYLRGLYFWDKRTEPDLRRAIDNFNAAVAREPSFAPAYAGLANSYNLLWYLGFMKAEEAVLNLGRRFRPEPVVEGGNPGPPTRYLGSRQQKGQGIHAAGE
jgi:hypothetical protein